MKMSATTVGSNWELRPRGAPGSLEGAAGGIEREQGSAVRHAAIRTCYRAFQATEPGEPHCWRSRLKPQPMPRLLSGPPAGEARIRSASRARSVILERPHPSVVASAGDFDSPDQRLHAAMPRRDTAAILYHGSWCWRQMRTGAGADAVLVLRKRLATSCRTARQHVGRTVRGDSSSSARVITRAVRLLPRWSRGAQAGGRFTSPTRTRARAPQTGQWDYRLPSRLSILTPHTPAARCRRSPQQAPWRCRFFEVTPRARDLCGRCRL